MSKLDKCRQIIDTESGRVLLYRDEVEAVLTAGDTISRRQAIDALGDEPEVWSGKDEYAQGLNNQWHYDRNAIKALPSAQPEPHWIPCSERLPEESGRYLISVLDGVGRRTTVAPYQPRYKAWTMTGRMAYWKVIAWLPLPEPYIGEEK